MEDRPRRRWPTALPLALIATVVLVLPLSAALELPFERQVKDAIGIGYKEPGCSPVVDRGSWGRWRLEGATPTPLEESRAARVGGGAYLVGGVTAQVVDNFGRSTAAFRRYDFRGGEFERLPDLPARLNHVGMAADGGSIYVVGGLGDLLEYRSEAADTLYRYAIAGGTWTELAPMNTARGALGADFLGGRLYAVGGRDGTDSLATVESYDPARDEWSVRAPLPSGRDHLGVAALGDYLYAAAGRRDGGEELAELYRYEPGADRWERLADLPLGTSGVTLERVGDELAVRGGEDSAQEWVTGRTYAYSPRSGKWRELPDSPLPKHGYASAGFGGRLYLFGGSRCAGSTPVDTIESLQVSSQGPAAAKDEG